MNSPLRARASVGPEGSSFDHLYADVRVSRDTAVAALGTVCERRSTVQPGGGPIHSCIGWASLFQCALTAGLGRKIRWTRAADPGRSTEGTTAVSATMKLRRS